MRLQAETNRRWGGWIDRNIGSINDNIKVLEANQEDKLFEVPGVEIVWRQVQYEL
jgi:hypothetical protein